MRAITKLNIALTLILLASSSSPALAQHGGPSSAGSMSGHPPHPHSGSGSGHLPPPHHGSGSEGSFPPHPHSGSGSGHLPPPHHGSGSEGSFPPSAGGAVAADQSYNAAYADLGAAPDSMPPKPAMGGPMMDPTKIGLIAAVAVLSIILAVIAAVFVVKYRRHRAAEAAKALTTVAPCPDVEDGPTVFAVRSALPDLSDWTLDKPSCGADDHHRVVMSQPIEMQRGPIMGVAHDNDDGTTKTL